ncbi:flagellin [Novosphingobium aquae]|uniref:Flagellin n=1 Tax=Novosphingobium aquae TaxID=3133435 RepID=A0ABU8S648_9SPHN
MTVINTNISAVRAANASNSAALMQGTAMQRLATGKRINSAKDDAAGLAISTSMTSQITGMQQGVRNANDDISLAQTAEGALNEVTNMPQEVTSLTLQVGSVLANTEFNGVALFITTAGTDITFDIQAGANAADVISVTSLAIDGTNIDATALDVSTSALAVTTMANVDAALAEVANTNAAFGGGESQLQSAINSLTSNSTNLSDARSRIIDADYSAATTMLAKAQILSQDSTAMIAQANQAQQNVLSLLK